MNDENTQDELEYPDYLRKDNISSAHFFYIVPRILENGKTYKRNEILKILIEFHEEKSGKKIQSTIEKVGHTLKKQFNNKELFEKIEGMHGGYIYIGTNEGKLTQSNKIKATEITNTSQEGLLTRKFIPQETIEGKSKGDESLYVWWHRDSEELANLQGKTEWAMKIGIHHARTVEERFEDYKTAIPYTPILGLLVHCGDSNRVEKDVHRTLKNRGKHINEMGSEWFITSVSEIKEIMKFNDFI